LKQQGLSNRSVAQRLGVTEKAIRKLVGPSKANKTEQLALTVPTSEGTTEPFVAPDTVTERAQEPKLAPTDADLDQTSAAVANAVEPTSMSFNGDAADRSMDRMFAYLGMLSDAAPIFRDGSQIPGAGVLLAIPALIDSGVFDISRKVYGEIGP